jgi:hypothetical protein
MPARVRMIARARAAARAKLSLSKDSLIFDAVSVDPIWVGADCHELWRPTISNISL